MLGALLTAAGLGALLFWALAVGDGGPAADPAGLPAAGRLVEWGLPAGHAGRTDRGRGHGRDAAPRRGAAAGAGRGAARGVAAGPPRARRRGPWRGLAATALGALLTLSRLLGTGPTELSWASLRVFVEDTGAGRAALLGVALVAVVAATAARSTVAGARVLLAVALTALVLPVVLSGHSSAADDHLAAVSTLGVHVVAATVWIGGLLAAPRPRHGGARR